MGGCKAKWTLVPLVRHQRRIRVKGESHRDYMRFSTRYRKLHAWPGQDHNRFQEPAHSRKQWSDADVYRVNIIYDQMVSGGLWKATSLWPGPS